MKTTLTNILKLCTIVRSKKLEATVRDDAIQLISCLLLDNCFCDELLMLEIFSETSEQTYIIILTLKFVFE